ncbi:uncharacterized protein LOC143631711 [Bidens hawaiensis]|uniref:uncharacterized protein LOC143631711 n=1 Tax=Bidens hawaiensis TaxID=980011 RepID=UPI00404A047B
MGNLICASYMTNKGSFMKVIYWNGNTKTLTGRSRLAGEIMFEFPECMVCDANRFFIGHAIPALAIDDRLAPGKTYFVLPLDIFSTEILSVSSISSFVSLMRTRTPADLKECPLEYINRSNGSVLIKVNPEFMARHLSCRGGYGYNQENDAPTMHVAIAIKCSTTVRKTPGSLDPVLIGINPSLHVATSSLCSTPELQKEYEQLVRSKDQAWSPNLDTISEANKIRYSPYRIIGLERGGYMQE